MKRIVIVTLFAAAALAVGSVRGPKPQPAVSHAKLTQRVSDDPPGPVCPPLPQEFCGPAPSGRQ